MKSTSAAAKQARSHTVTSQRHALGFKRLRARPTHPPAPPVSLLAPERNPWGGEAARQNWALEQRSTRAATAGPAGLADAIVGILTADTDVVAAFCVVWPNEFAFGGDIPPGAAVESRDLFAVPRATLLSAFEGEQLGHPTQENCWRLDLLPESLRRPPFTVSAGSKLTLPISLGQQLIGLIGLVLVDGSALERHRGACAHPLSQRSGIIEEGSAPPTRPRAVQAKRLGGAEKELSPREREIAAYLEEGYSTINIGALLGISTNTVRTYVRRIYTKLNVCNRVDLVRRGPEKLPTQVTGNWS